MLKYHFTGGIMRACNGVTPYQAFSIHHSIIAAEAPVLTRLLIYTVMISRHALCGAPIGTGDQARPAAKIIFLFLKSRLSVTATIGFDAMPRAFRWHGGNKASDTAFSNVILLSPST